MRSPGSSESNGVVSGGGRWADACGGDPTEGEAGEACFQTRFSPQWPTCLKKDKLPLFVHERTMGTDQAISAGDRHPSECATDRIFHCACMYLIALTRWCARCKHRGRATHAVTGNASCSMGTPPIAREESGTHDRDLLSLVHRSPSYVDLPPFCILFTRSTVRGKDAFRTFYSVDAFI